ncbi:integrin beta-1-B-like [Apostichopus japonicus]|uniref:integrin beta-1-B-like n=1 Tax=Stichopus japonicus TaxID=307972 RepID=UPI003AB6F424
MKALCFSFLSLLMTTQFLESNCEECPSLSKTCHECISMPGCAWCKNETFLGSRCDTVESLTITGCYSYENPMPIFETPKNEDVTDGTYLNDEDEEPVTPAVQIQPQEIRIKLRQGEPHRFTVKVRQALNYPVDLYYLMDLSYSMGDDLTNLKRLAEALGDSLKTTTRRAKLGFGSFVDKPILPYIDITSSAIDEPCQGCEKAYSFRNVHPLHNDVTEFATRINDVSVSGNLDMPEGTFDAVMQVSVCNEQIGWRKKARKLLLVTTDASTHIQGDGRIGGVFTPNDGACHIDEYGVYNQSHLYDYPSVAFLNEKLVKNNIIPIFAVPSSSREVYNRLSVLIQGARTATLSTDSKNVVGIIQHIYNEITETVEIADDAPKNLQLKITANCGDDVRDENSKVCSGINLGREVTFEIEITAQGCMPDGATNQSFIIYPIGLDEQLTVHVDVYCECTCENIRELNSDSCTDGNGTLSCGTCDCNHGRYGDYCECDGNNLGDILDTSACKSNNQTDVICSGRGECICGECRCQEKLDGENFYGSYCECSNKSCPIYNGEVCGGTDRGECKCDGGRVSRCSCKPGYSGHSCDCLTSDDTCISPQTGLICNAKGTCKCGSCSCSSSKFYGQFCESCVTEDCTECDLHVDCIKCNIFEVGLSKDDCAMCSQIIKKVPVLPDDNTTSFRKCSYIDDDECTVLFSYSKAEINNTIVIYVNPKPKCSSTKKTGLNILTLIIGISMGIVLLGVIFIMLFRTYTWYLDKKEYEQLIQEQKNVQWQKSDNPLYKQGIQTFKNPMYGKAASTKP